MKKFLIILFFLFSFNLYSYSIETEYFNMAFVIEQSVKTISKDKIIMKYKPKNVSLLNFDIILQDNKYINIFDWVELLTDDEREFLAGVIFKYILDNPGYPFSFFITLICFTLPPKYEELTNVLIKSSQEKSPIKLLKRLFRFRGLVPPELKLAVDEIGWFGLYFSMKKLMSI